MRHRVVAVAGCVVAALFPGQSAAGAEPPTVVTSPTVVGEAVYRSPVVADPGDWVPAEGLTLGYQWLRGPDPIGGATRPRYRPALDDVGRRLRVQVTATDETGQQSAAATSAAVRVRRAPFERVARPPLSGTRRYTEVLRAGPGRWRPRHHRTGYRWLRDGTLIKGAKGPRYRLRPGDVGHRIKVLVSVRKQGYRVDRATSRPTRRIMHRVPLKRTVTYRVETRGDISASMRVFRRQVAQTFADPRGWRSAGIAFKRVRKGGDFSVVLAEAATVPSFSSGCSARWSCRVGRHVIINQMRWRHATPSWNHANQSLRGYRHMVVNHETGHWLGHGHLGCPGDGRAAPVMMQQSKGLGGCRHNPWPRTSELWFR